MSTPAAPPLEFVAHLSIAVGTPIDLGALPNDMFGEQIRRFGRDVLPILQAHQITHVPAAEARAA